MYICYASIRVIIITTDLNRRSTSFCVCIHRCASLYTSIREKKKQIFWFLWERKRMKIYKMLQMTNRYNNWYRKKKVHVLYRWLLLSRWKKFHQRKEWLIQLPIVYCSFFLRMSVFSWLTIEDKEIQFRFYFYLQKTILRIFNKWVFILMFTVIWYDKLFSHRFFFLKSSEDYSTQGHVFIMFHIFYLFLWWFWVQKKKARATEIWLTSVLFQDEVNVCFIFFFVLK